MTDETLLQLACRLSCAQYNIALNQAVYDSCAAKVKELIEPGEHEQAGDYEISVSKGSRRLDKKKLMAAYPFAEHPELYKPEPDAAAVKKALEPEEYESLCSQSEGSVKVQ